MKDHESHSAISNVRGKTFLPLYDFFIALKRNNFLVTPAQITDANRLLNHYSDSVESEWELCDYLTPIFAKSEEEQIHFRQIYEEFFIPLPVKETTTNPIRSRQWLLLISAIATTLIAFVVIPMLVGPPEGEVILNFETILAPVDSTIAQRRLDLRLSVENDSSFRDVKAKIDWGDNAPVDTLLSHYYKRDGIYTLTAFVEIKNDLLSYHKDTIQTDVSICLSPATIQIGKSFKDSSIALNKRFRLTAEIKGKQPDSVRWSSTNLKTFKNGETNDLVTTANIPGDNTFFFEAFYGGANAPCNIKEEISFLVSDATPKPEIIFNKSNLARAFGPQNKVYRRWYNLLATSGVVSVIFFIFFNWRRKKLNKQHVENLLEDQHQYDEMINSFSGKTGSIDIPFHKKNFLPLPEPELSDVAKLMRRRIRDNASYVHLDRTILKAIHNAGFFEPVIESRTQQSEFLVLIAKKNENDQQVKLFEYLLELLKKQNVYVDKYYYNRTPLECYHENETSKTSLEKLSEKYPGHVLLIFGDGHQLIYPNYPVIDKQSLQLLNRWQYKAIITPVSFKDWGQIEKKVLLPQLPVLPIDIKGLLILMQKLFDQEVNVSKVLYQLSSEFYEVDMVDFEDMEELLEYCELVDWANVPDGSTYSNILFQWIAALTVYPKINWELSLAIGKAILDRNNMAQELNFTNLLRLVRVSWMKEGRIPDYIRLDLLKALSVENEIIARETILHALNEIPKTELNKNHFAFEEKETQRLINEFNLYACDPIKYMGFNNSKALFAQLDKEGLLTDITTKSYLENSELQWQTLINEPPRDERKSKETKVTSLKNYLGIKPEEKNQKAKVYFWGILASTLLFAGTILGFIWLKSMLNNENEQYSAFVYKSPFTKDVEFNFNFSDVSQSTRTLVLSIDADSVDILKAMGTSADSLGIGLSTFKIPVIINDSSKQVMVHWNNRHIIDSNMVINHDTYDLTLVSDKATPNVLTNEARWEQAINVNTLRGYSEYVKLCAENCHSDEIEMAIKQLLNQEGFVQVINSDGTLIFGDVEDFYLEGDFLVAKQDRTVRSSISPKASSRGVIRQGRIVKVNEYVADSQWAKISYSNSDGNIGGTSRSFADDRVNESLSTENSQEDTITDPTTKIGNEDSLNLGEQNVITDSTKKTSKSVDVGGRTRNGEENRPGDSIANKSAKIYQDDFTDTDGDGTIDTDDYCPNDKGSFDNNGCPGPNTITNEIKWETLKLLDQSNTPFEDSKDEITYLLNKIEKEIADGSGKNKNDIKNKAWKMLIDDNHLLGSYFKLWEEQGVMSLAFIQEFKPQIVALFDLMISYEEKGDLQIQKSLETFSDNVGYNNESNGQVKQNSLTDSDGDGVSDVDDQCPDVAGTSANSGCPEVTEEVQKQLNDYARTILFDTGKSSIKVESTSIIIDIIQVLKEFPTANFIVEGHTDNVGSAKLNQSLSESRALSVKKFLVDKGISEDRLSSRGYGQDLPIASNNTRAGRNQNRRVEINLIKK